MTNSKSNETIYFIPADISSTLTIGELTQYMADIIKEIRQGAFGNYYKINEQIKKLQGQEKIIEEIRNKFGNNGKNDANSNDVITVFNLYHEIIQTSLLLRKILPKGLDLGDYDGLDYALYYNGHRYSAEELKVDWLRISSRNKGELEINIAAATEDLQKSTSSVYKESFQSIIDNHYNNYQAMIVGTYNGPHIPGRINYGHIAEAFEEHLQETHPSLSHISRIADTALIQNSAAFQAVTALDIVNAKEWAEHEEITKGWMHIRHSLGTQRGTVAGDVGSTQVKQGPKTRLANFNTIKQAIELYSAILGPNSDPNGRDIPNLAYKLARYMSEPVSKKAADVLNITAAKEIDEEIKAMFKSTNRNMNAVIHI